MRLAQSVGLQPRFMQASAPCMLGVHANPILFLAPRSLLTQAWVVQLACAWSQLTRAHFDSLRPPYVRVCLSTTLALAPVHPVHDILAVRPPFTPTKELPARPFSVSGWRDATT